MSRFMHLLRLDFLPPGPDFGLLVLRLWAGLSMAYLHGWGKFINFSKMAPDFPDPIGLGSQTALSLLVFAELGCALLLALGLFTRFAALVLAIAMSVAFFTAHGGALSGPNSGEIAFLYLAIFTTIFIAGGGRFSLDAAMRGSRRI